MLDVWLRVSKTSSSMTGTSSGLREGSYIRLIDALYALMLPSGNDAAYLLAETFGLLMLYERLRPVEKQYSDIESIDLSPYASTDHFVTQFIKHMNKKAKSLSMRNSCFVNPHGLQNAMNYSTAKDMLSLSLKCSSNDLISQIMKAESYVARFYEDQDCDSPYVEITWENTNRLLSNGWSGIKTGHTTSAGACLASVKDGVYMVVLNSQSTDKRFDDTIALYEWYCKEFRTNSK